MSAVIIGIEGTMLLAQEAALLHRPFCAGVILFSRNYSSPAQLKRLCATIRAQRPDALICVDHEGGRVQRFRDGFTVIPAMGAFGRCFDRRPLLACELAEAAGVVIAYELRQLALISALPRCWIYKTPLPALSATAPFTPTPPWLSSSPMRCGAACARLA